MLKSMEDRHFFEDEEVREGMATHRGFLVSVPRSYPLDVFSGVECRVDSTDIALSQPDDAEGADHVAPINAIVMLHRGSLDLMDVAGPLWAANGRRVIAVANHDCPRDYPWAERVIVWDTDPGHIGHEHCKRLLAAVDEAARLEGPTAISEADGFLVHDFPVEPGCFYGSERFDTRKTKSIIASPYCEISAFCPWVTDQAGWQAIAKVMRAWCDSENFPDQGYADRVITAAAVDSGLKVNGIGYNRFPCILPSDKEALQAAVSAGKSPLVHGIKAPDVLEWIFTD
jgi:hypothetical protein